MSKRMWRAGLFGLPLIGLGVVLVSACADEDIIPTGGADASPDVAVIDAANETSSQTPDGSTGLTDAGSDAADAAPDAPDLPALCTTYSNAEIPLYPDASVDEQYPMPRWDIIAFNALEAAANACEIGAAFADNSGIPSAYECLGIQLAGLVGCPGVIDYANSNDVSNGAPCAAADAGDVVELGFRNPQDMSYSLKDVDFFIAQIGTAAQNTGIAPSDVARLVTLLQAQRSGVVGNDGLDAGPDGGDYSQSSCP